MAGFSKAKWPVDGPVRALLSYLDILHRQAGQPTLAQIGRAVALAPSTLSAFFTGTRLIGSGNLELLVEHLGGDPKHAEQLRRRAVPAWHTPRTARTAVFATDSQDGTARLEIVLFDAPDNRLNRPELLIGREQLLDELAVMLDRGERVLLHGLGGSGKTALAATLADRRTATGGGPYLWLRPGSSDVDATVDGLVRAIATAAERDLIASAAGDARLTAIGAVIARLGVAFVVLDDVGKPLLAHMLVRAVPAGIGLVVTSRLKLGLPHVIEVAELAPHDALALLTLHADRAWPDQAEELCRDLGHHPYALEIAGHHLRLYGASPAELRADLAGAPHALAMPGSFAALGRESLTRLLDRTYAALDDVDAHAVLAAFGALFTGTATAELLAVYLRFDLARTRAALHRLIDMSLVKRTAAYAMHDLTFSYARSLGGESSLKAVTEFVAIHAGDYRLLALELENLLAAATHAREVDQTAFLAIITTLVTGGYLDHHGHTLGLLRLLDVAIETVCDGDPQRHFLVTKRGNSHYDRGELSEAIDVYRWALRIAPDAHRRTVILSLLAKVFAEQGHHEQAEEHLNRAYALAPDDQSTLRVLEQHTQVAFRRKDYQGVREVAARGIELSRRLGARTVEVVFLNNLGTAEFELGVSTALCLHEQARALAGELGNDFLLALTNRTTGADFHAQENQDIARERFTEALRLYTSLGKKDRESKLRRLMLQFGYLKGPM